jgi:hypothetical protein
VTSDAGYDVIEVGDGHWSVHEAGTTRSVGTLQKDADGYRLVDAQDADLGTFATLEEAIARLSDGR